MAKGNATAPQELLINEPFAATKRLTGRIGFEPAAAAAGGVKKNRGRP